MIQEYLSDMGGLSSCVKFCAWVPCATITELGLCGVLGGVRTLLGSAWVGIVKGA